MSAFLGSAQRREMPQSCQGLGKPPTQAGVFHMEKMGTLWQGPVGLMGATAPWATCGCPNAPPPLPTHTGHTAPAQPGEYCVHIRARGHWVSTEGPPGKGRARAPALQAADMGLSRQGLR